MTTMTTVATPAAAAGPLRFALRFDGIMTLPSGVLVAVLAGVLADPLGIPTAVLLGAGLFFVAWGAAVFFAGTRPVINRRVGAGIGIVNAVCALDGVVIVAAGVGNLTTLGAVLLVALSAAVAGIGALQLVGARR